MADSSAYDDIFEQAGKDNNVDPDLLRAIAKQESGFNPKAVGPMTKSGRAHGMMQLIPATADALGVKDPFNPKQAIPAAARLISQNLDQYGNVEDAISAYHGGTDQSQWGPKTQKYREAVSANYGGGQAAPQGGDNLLSLAAGGKAAAATAQDGSGAASAPDVDDGVNLLAAAAGVAPGSDTFHTTDTDEPITAKQQDVVKAAKVSGVWDDKADLGSENHPYFLTEKYADPSAYAPGSYYVDTAGKLSRTPGGKDMPEGQSDNRLAAGFSRGLGDVAQSVAPAFPGHGDSPIYQGLKYDQMLYDANHKGDIVAGIPRLAGQIVGSAPLMGGVEAGAAKMGLAKLLGPAGTFLAGKAGAEALPEGASLAAKGVQLGTKVASKMSGGAVQGAEAAALTNSASDQPLAEQIKTGAALGSVVGPIGGLLMKGGKQVVSKLLGYADGAAPVAAQRSAQEAAQNLPVPVRLTTGQVTASPTQQMLENSMLKGTKGAVAQQTMKDAATQTDAALRANVPAIQSQMAGAPISANEGGAMVSDKLAAMRAAAKTGVDANYDAARAVGGDAMLSTAKDIREGVLKSVSDNYTLGNVPRVAAEVESLGEGGAPTVRDLFDKRSKLSSLTQSSDPVEAGAAKTAVKAMDSHIEDAMANDLFLGDPKAVDAWKKAVSSRAAFGKAFEGDDFIERLTEPTQHGGGTTLKVAPEDAANFIFGANDIGFTTKKNFTRDMTRLKSTLGPDSPEWGALRAEAFARIARSAGPSDKPFSGAGFQTAWSKAKDRAPQALDVLFSPKEKALIDDFADTARRATSSVKGGDNPSNSGIYLDAVKNFMTGIGAPTGVAAGTAIGSLMGHPVEGGSAGLAVGKGLDTFFSQISNAQTARKAAAGRLAKPTVDLDPRLKLLGQTTSKVPLVGGVSLLGSQVAAPQPAQ